MKLFTWSNFFSWEACPNVTKEIKEIFNPITLRHWCGFTVRYFNSFPVPRKIDALVRKEALGLFHHSQIITFMRMMMPIWNLHVANRRNDKNLTFQWAAPYLFFYRVTTFLLGPCSWMQVTTEPLGESLRSEGRMLRTEYFYAIVCESGRWVFTFQCFARCVNDARQWWCVKSANFHDLKRQTSREILCRKLSKIDGEFV